MKYKRLILAGLALMLVAYFVMAYIFMWQPLFRHSARSSAKACGINLRQIDAAVNQYALEHHKHTGDPVTFSDISPYINLDRNGKIYACPAGGIYTFSPIGTGPTCSLGSNLPPKVRWGFFRWDYADHKLP